MSQELFNVSIISLPLNFTILLHPDSIESLGIEENGYALMKGVNDQITVVKVIKDPDCPRTTTKITHSVQLTLAASPGDCVPILPFSGDDICEAVQVAPLFDKHSSSNEREDYTPAVKHYFNSDQRPISVDSIFTLLINSEQRVFKILKCLPCDRSFSNKSTKIYFANEPGPLLPKPSIPKHLSTLVLDKSLINFIKNNIYYPVNRQSILRSLNLSTSTGIVIEGPNGTGKTSLLSAISNTINIPSIYCAAKRLKKLSVSDFVEKLNQIFGFTAEKPQCLIMFDDLDHVLSSFKETKITSERCKLATFINLLDFVMQRPGIVVIVTVTSCNTMDSTLFRDGRFGQHISLHNPTIEQRKEMVRFFTAGMRIDNDDLDAIVRKIGGNGDSNEGGTVSSKELERICRVAVASLIEEVTGTQGSDVVDSLAVYALNTKMKSMHFGVTSRTSSQSSRKSRSRFDDDGEDDREHRHRRRRRRRHHRNEDDEEEDNENNEEEDDDESHSSRRRRRHRRRRRDQTSFHRSRSRRNRHREQEDEEEDDDDNSRRSRSRQRQPESGDEEEDEEIENNSRRSRSRRERSQNSRRKYRNSESEEDEIEEFINPFDKKNQRKVQVPKRKTKDESSDDDDRIRSKSNRRQNLEDSEDEESNNSFSNFGNKSKKKNVNNESSDDDQNDRRKRRQFPARMNSEDDDQEQFSTGKNKKIIRRSRSRKQVERDDE